MHAVPSRRPPALRTTPRRVRPAPWPRPVAHPHRVSILVAMCARALPLLLLLPLVGWAPAAAAARLLTGERPLVPAGETIRDDVYASGSRVVVAGDVDGDVVVAAGDVEIRGAVSGDVLAAGGLIRLLGSVGGSARLMGGTLLVGSRIEGDLVALGGTLHVTEEASIGRDLLVGGGELRIAGPVGRDARIGAGELELLADVAGDVDLEVETVEVGPVTIGGTLSLPSHANESIAGDARIRGGIDRRADEWRAPRGPAGGWIAAGIWTWVRLLVGLWALGALFSLGAPRWSERAVALQLRKPGPAVLTGVAVLLGTPVVALLLFLLGLLVGGWWIGIFLLVLYGIALFVSVPIAGRALGELLVARWRKRWHWTLSLLIGLSLLLLAGVIPIAGQLLLFAALLFGLGCLVLAPTGFSPGSPAPPAAKPTAGAPPG